jgi:hypothetical protein
VVHFSRASKLVTPERAAGNAPAPWEAAMSLSPLAAEPLARKALLLQAAIAGLIASHKVEPQLACALAGRGPIASHLRPAPPRHRAGAPAGARASGPLLRGPDMRLLIVAALLLGRC